MNKLCVFFRGFWERGNDRSWRIRDICALECWCGNKSWHAGFETQFYGSCCTQSEPRPLGVGAARGDRAHRETVAAETAARARQEKRAAAAMVASEDGVGSSSSASNGFTGSSTGSS